MTVDPGGAAAAPRTEIAATPTARGLPIAARIVLLLAVLAAAGIYLGAASNVYRSLRGGEDVTAENLKAAARLEPSNAEFPYRLGRYSLLAQDFPVAIADFKAAIALNPYDARFWLDLSGAYLATGDMAGQQRALARALEADPTTPEVIWQTANYELVRGDTEKATQRFHTLVEHDSDFLPGVMNICWRATRDPDLIAEKVLPARPEAHADFIRFLRVKRAPEAADKAWAHLIALKQPFPVQIAFPYLDYLVSRGEFAAVDKAWAQVAVANPELRAYVPSSNDQIVNGGFELDLLNGGLDWRYVAKEGASVIIDPNRAHSGNRSLSVTFDGAPDDSGVFQLVPVRGNTRYQFSGFIMAEALETVSPPRFSVLGLRTNDPYLVTAGVRDATGWQEFQGEFTAGPADDMLLVRVVRVPGRRLIRGKIWVDDVKLVPEP
jgi:tetratricopeptide (TPR) repeat protein